MWHESMEETVPCQTVWYGFDSVLSAVKSELPSDSRVRPTLVFLQAADLRKHPTGECWPPALRSESRPGPRQHPRLLFWLGLLVWAHGLLAGLSSDYE